MNTLRETVTTPLDDRANPAHEGAIAPGAPEAPLPELDLDTVKEILGIPNEHLRNLRVTLFYHDLSRRLGRLIGFENANWCTFAVWASRQAGFVIRGEVARMSRVRDFVMENDGRPALSDESKGQQKLPEAWAESPSSEGESSDLWARWTRWRRATHWTHWKKGRVDPLALLVLVFASFSRATSEGNTKVFEDIATAFVPFLRLLEKSTSLEDPDLTEYLAKLNPLPSRDGGRLELKVGLLQYWRARHETDPGRRARHILHGNACVGYHEQTRLQQEISLAVNMPIEYLRDDLVMWYTYGPGARFVFTSGAGWMINTLVRRAAIPVAEWVASQERTELHDVGDDLPTEVEALVHEYFELSTTLRQIVTEVSNVVLPNVQPSTLDKISSSLQAAPTRAELKKYANTLVSELERGRALLGGSGSFQAQVDYWRPGSSEGMGRVVVRAIAGTAKGASVANDSTVEALLQDLSAMGLLSGVLDGGLGLRGDVLVQDGTAIHFAKPLLRRLWLTSAALDDALKIIRHVHRTQASNTETPRNPA